MTAAPARLAAALADRYRIARELGQGGMATVYLAEDLKHRRKVAVKVLKPELAAVLGAERFVQEITTTAALQHPHILPLFDSGTADGFLYYVMPFIDGETLRSRLDRETQFGVDEAVRITREVADALDYAHRHGVIHRDIKPENILLHDGRPMVADFGIALALSAAAGGRMTETGLSLGTPHYMSPEQATAEKEITGRSDVYSLGSVLYEMLTGNPPHVGASAQQIIMKIVTEEAAPVTKFRKSVPPHVAAAVAVSLEKLPADRFESAKAFAEALGNPGFATRTPAASAAVPGRGAWLSDRRTIGTLAMAGAALVAAAWFAARPGAVQGPTEYDVGLPDSAEMWTMRGSGFAVAPGGDFVVYQVVRAGRGELWYRSLLDGRAHRIDGTDDGWQPALSHDGTRLAFFRERAGSWTVEVMPVSGGAATTLGSGTSTADLQWLGDGRVMVVEADGKRVRWFDPAGGPSTGNALAYCIMPSRLLGRDALACGGGGDYRIHLVGFQDSVTATYLYTGSGADSAPVLGSHPTIIEGKYLVYVSRGGDLQAAAVDLGTGRVGRSVRLVTGLGRREYSGAGTYGISASGTLVYANGVDHAVGHLVQMDERGMDTLPLGREAFLRIAFSPDRRRLAAVVEGREGQELRIYDLRTGQYVPWVRRWEIRQPVWSPQGDRLLFSDANAVFVGSPGRAGAPESVYITPHRFEGWTWLPGDRVLGTLMRLGVAVVLDVNARPATLDTLLTDASFTRLSPDGRWIAYNDRSITSLWLEPFPRDGRRYQLAANRAGEPQWRSPSELAVQTTDLPQGVDRMTINTGTEPPEVVRRPWLVLPGFLETAGQSATLAPDGRIVYVRGAEETAVPWLRVVPRWVDQMKRAVDEANR